MAEVEIRAGILMSLRRMVPLRALLNSGLAVEPTARERLNAITANTSQAALAGNQPKGRCARALSLRSAFICSMLCRCLHKIDYLDVRVMPMFP